MDSMHPLGEIEPEIGQRLMTRRRALQAGARSSSAVAAGLALATVPTALAALARDAFAQGGLPGIVVSVLNFALLLEHLEAEFYTRGVSESGLLQGNDREVFDQIRKHEVAHVEYLRSVLGERAIAKPTFDYTAGGGGGNGPFGDVFRNPRTFAAVAQAFEDTGVRAYKGQAANLMGEEDVLEAALKIHSVEARHAAQVRRMRGQKGWIVGDSRGDLPEMTQAIYEGEDNRFHILTGKIGGGLTGAPSSMSAFDETLTRGQVMEIVRPFIAEGRDHMATDGAGR